MDNFNYILGNHPWLYTSVPEWDAASDLFIMVAPKTWGKLKSAILIGLMEGRPGEPLANFVEGAVRTANIDVESVEARGAMIQAYELTEHLRSNWHAIIDVIALAADEKAAA